MSKCFNSETTLLKNNEVSLVRLLSHPASKNISIKNKILSVCYQNLKFNLRCEDSDIDVYCQVIIDNEYKNHIEFIKQYINDNDRITIIDAGANIGCASLLFYKNFKESKIISIEPDLSNYNLLQQNTKGINNITSLNNAIWSTKTNLEIDNRFRDNKSWSKTVVEIKQEKNNAIKGLSPTDIINNHNLDTIDIIKIDIEGSEKDLFFNKNANLEWLNVTKFLIIEIHEEVVSASEIIKLLSEYGFSYTNYGELTLFFNKKKLNA